MTVASDSGLFGRTDSIRATIRDLERLFSGNLGTPITAKAVVDIRGASRELMLRLDEFDAEPSLLTVMLLGGTGVGKSTLLNALAGSRIAQSGIVRPTTQYATIYHHCSVDLSLLPEPFQHGRRVAHERSELRYKILIDTPDMDGSVVEHHDRLREMLPIADTVLYVGSSEKYHDQAAWKLLLEQSSTRGFAFILNKWDRCLAAFEESTGTPPDEDFRRSLEDAGFEEPLLFRVCGRQWEARRAEGKTEFAMVEDDFEHLLGWIEAELDERTIRDIKTRGIAGEIERILLVLNGFMPPDWSRKLHSVRARWEQALRASLSEHAKLLTEAAGSQSADLERHFGRIGRHGVRGLFGVYLRLVDQLVYLRGMLLPSGAGLQKTEMQRIAAKCLDAIPSMTRRTHRDALRDRLLAIADHEGWPIESLRQSLLEADDDEESSPLADPVLAGTLSSELAAMEKDYVAPEGRRRIVQFLVRQLCMWLPLVVLGGIAVSLVYSLFHWTMWGIGELFSATLLLVLTFAALHFLLVWAFPVRWESLRVRLLNRLENSLLRRLAPGYTRALDRLAEQLIDERKAMIDVRDSLQLARDALRRQEQQTSTSLFARFRMHRRGA